MSIHLRSAWNHITRSPFQALAAFFVLTITFFVITLLTTIVYSSSQVIGYFETRPQIIAFLKEESEQKEISELHNRLQSDGRVKGVTYVSKEEALEIYKNATSDNPLLSELVSPSIFPASLEVSLSDLTFTQEVIDQLKQENIVDQIGFTASLGGEDRLSEAVDRLKSITFYVRIGGGIFATILVGVSFLVLIVIIGMRMTTRRGEIEILELIGATRAFIRSPIILEAIIYGLVGAAAGWLFATVIVLYSTPSLISYFGEIPVLPQDTASLMGLFGIILAGELVMGLLLGLIGSFLAVSRVKRRV
jgi:cell division transport system permease protein